MNFKFPYSAEEYAKNLYLENYHCHKDFSNTSTPDCAESIENYAKRVHEFNAKCLFSGEHGSQGNQFQVYKVAESEKLKYIHSSEVYWVKNRLEKDRTNCHMIIAARNAEGRGDINFALSIANEDGYYYKPRIDLELLFNIPKDNVIVTSACVAGWNYEDAEDIWIKIHNYFGDNFFLEVQYHNTEKQKKLNEKILRIARENNIQIICGLDSHYVKDENSVKRDQILKYKNVNYPDEDGWYMDYPDTQTVIKRFKEQGVLSDEEILRAIMNTNVFVSKCEEIVLDRTFKIPSVYKGKTYDEKCKIYKNVLNIAYSKEKEKSKEKADGIRYEAKEVMEAGVVDYFLTSKAIVDEAVKNQGGILTTTSRGSAASFITNKLLGLTTVDRFNADIPIYPERFLTKERVLAGQMPDIDLNVATQEPFVKAAKKLLGEHGCYPLMAIEKLKEKAAWQLYAGANDVKPEDANQISKYLDEYNKALKYADDDEKEDIHVEDYIPEEYIELFKQSNEYQGITINLKVHACFTKGQLVLTDKGYKEIQDIKIGEYVLTHNNQYQQVLDVQKLKSNDIYSLKITGDDVIATGNHPFYVISNKNKLHRDFTKPYWKELKNITCDDWVGSPINQKSIIPTFETTNITYKNTRFIDLSDKNIWWLIGRYIGDGWTEHPRKNAYRIVICCNKKGKELLDITSRIPDYLSYNVDEANTTYKITFNNKTLYDYLQQFEKYAYGKKLTNDIFDLPCELLKQFLYGYLSADGSIQDKYYTFSTVSRELAYGLQQCIQKVFLRPCTITTTSSGIDVIENRICNRRKKYRGKFKIKEDPKDVNKVIDGYIWYKVRELKKLDKDDYVYNLSVNNDNSYTVNNFAVHNCGHFIFDGDIRREVGLISAVSETTGKRTICAAIEGGFLDEFGYVKEDFLIVDSVYLTYKFFHSIGMEVPTFDELRKMIDGDKATWDIYAKGITCCVNQCEKEATTNRVKKYKPQNLAELSNFIAAIRPGFASLLNTFLNRESYTTGETKIDSLLEDTSHFMIYQESIMKVLSFLKLAMGKTYGVIKSISKKKLKGEKKENLLSELNAAWLDEFNNTDNFNNVWNVIEDSAKYAFNSPHAYSMGGDSAYQAWFKAHHTATFYEVAINHYQEKNKKDKIDALVKEAIKFYGYKLGNYEFGTDNRTVTIDEEKKLIYPNLSSIKGFGEGVSQTLYELGQKQYKDFVEVLTALFSNSINKTIVDKLIKIDYFRKYGDINTLLAITKYYDVLYDAKTISKDKAEKNGLPFELLSKYGNETAKQFNKIDSLGLLNELIGEIPYSELTLKEKLDNQREVLGIVTDYDPNADKRLYYVSELDVKKSVVNIDLYEIFSGKTRKVKMWTSQYNKNPFNLGNILYIISLDKKHKKEPTGEINEVTGKKVYKEVPDKFEYWLRRFIVKDETEDGDE